MTAHINSNRRKELIGARFTSVIKQILTWSDPMYPELELFKLLLIELNSDRQRLMDHIGSAILDGSATSSGQLPLINEYLELSRDIDENYAEYKTLLKTFFDEQINTKYQKFSKYWNDLDKYLILIN